MLRFALLTLPVCFWFGTLACAETHEADGGVSGSPSVNGGAGMSGSAPSGGAGARNDSGGSGGVVVNGGAGSGQGGSSAAGAATGGAVPSAGVSGAGDPAESPSLLVFSRTAAYRHDSIPAGVQALTKLAMTRGWQLAATEDASKFSDAGLASYN